MSRAIASQTSTLNIKQILLKIISLKSKASALLISGDEDQNFALEGFAQQKMTSDQLRISMKINPDFIRKVQDTLRELKQLSDSRKPEEDDDDTQMQQAA